MNERITQKWTTGDLNALVKNLGEELARKIQRGEVSVRVEEILKTLFDKTGRRIPQSIKANVCDPDRGFNLVQPAMATLEDYAVRLQRLHKNLGIDTGIAVSEFKQEIERQLELVQSNPKAANILKGVWLPIVLPKLEANDLGDILERYLKAFEKSYLDNFPKRKFNNYREGEIKDKVSVVEARYDEVIKRMKQEPVVAIYFPNSLQGFSINASREQAESLPESFALSGFEAALAGIMYPEVMLRDFHTPGFDLAGFAWRSSDYSLYLKARDVSADFGNRGCLADAYDGYSAGLVFFG